MSKTLAEVTAEIREVNVTHGWRSAEGGPGTNTFGDYIALLHSEVSEALEVYRDHRLADATKGIGSVYASQGINGIPKPEGVGSELADVLIRLLDMCDVFGIVPFDMDCKLADVHPLDVPEEVDTFGDHLAWLHKRIAHFDLAGRNLSHPKGSVFPLFLRALVAVAERYGIDLTAEYKRKIAYNRTRPYQHGGRTVSDAGSA